MSLWQHTVVRVLALRQFRITRIYLDQLAGRAGLTLPSQPPPLVTVLRGGGERHVIALVSGAQLTAELVAGRMGIRVDGGHRQ
jgi:hypothetical protein